MSTSERKPLSNLEVILGILAAIMLVAAIFIAGMVAGAAIQACRTSQIRENAITGTIQSMNNRLKERKYSIYFRESEDSVALVIPPH